MGVPLEAIPGFVSRLEALYKKTTGEAVKKSPGSGPKPTIAKGGKAAKEAKGKEKPKKEKKEKEAPPPKPTMEDLDAELANYTSLRGAEPAAEEAPAPAE